MKLITNLYNAQNYHIDFSESDIKQIESLTMYRDIDRLLFSGPVICYTKFNITPKEVEYSKDEHDFRMVCLKEEWTELKTAYSEKNEEEFIDAIVDMLIFAIGTSYRYNDLNNLIIEYPSYNTMNAQYIINDVKRFNKTREESLIDMTEYYISIIVSNFQPHKYTESISRLVSLLIVYLFDTYNKDMIVEYYKRVTNANLSKELGSLPKRGSFAIDLVKPAGWTAPSFAGL